MCSVTVPQHVNFKSFWTTSIGTYLPTPHSIRLSLSEKERVDNFSYIKKQPNHSRRHCQCQSCKGVWVWIYGILYCRVTSTEPLRRATPEIAVRTPHTEETPRGKVTYVLCDMCTNKYWRNTFINWNHVWGRQKTGKISYPEGQINVLSSPNILAFIVHAYLIEP